MNDAKFLNNVAWIILIVATLISVGIFAISALFTSISLQKDCIITALFAFMIGGYIAIFVFTLSAIIDYEEWRTKEMVNNEKSNCFSIEC